MHILSGLFDFLYKYNMVCVPTTNNLNRTFLLEYYPLFFNILKLVLRKAVRVISTPGIHTGISTSMPICHGIITSILCSKTFWLVSCLYYCFTVLRHILGHLERGQLAYPHCSWASLIGSLPVLTVNVLIIRTETDNYFTSNWQLPSWISGRERMIVKYFL